MRLKRLKIETFKGVEALEIMAEGQNVEIRGENGTGKTTVFDAYIWALTGKLSDGSAAADKVKRIGANGVKQLKAETPAVEVEFTNGLTIRREYKEKYAKGVFNGHATSILVNGGHQCHFP